MKRVLWSLGFLLIFLTAHAWLAHIAHAYGFGLALIVGVCAGAAWVAHSTESKAFADDLLGALRDCGISQDAACIDMGISPSQFSDALAGKRHLSAWHVAQLPPVCQVALAKRRLARFGSYFVVEDGTLAQLLNEIQQLSCVSCRKPMVKMALTEKRRKGAA